jgi:hypothetical protein
VGRVPAGDDLIAQRLPAGLDSGLASGHGVTGCVRGCGGCEDLEAEQDGGEDRRHGPDRPISNMTLPTGSSLSLEHAKYWSMISQETQ